MTTTPYEALGGRDAVYRLAHRFYDLMEEGEPELAALHPMDETGRVAGELRERFALFLVGWLGGPQEYHERHGHPRLRMRHMHVAIDAKMRDAWLRCMLPALAEMSPPPEVHGFLVDRLSHVADFLRNQSDESTYS